MKSEEKSIITDQNIRKVIEAAQEAPLARGLALSIIQGLAEVIGPTNPVGHLFSVAAQGMRERDVKN